MNSTRKANDFSCISFGCHGLTTNRLTQMMGTREWPFDFI